MNAHDLIRSQLRLSLFVLDRYLRDLSEDELLMRPTPQANHAAWQLGHLIESHTRQLSALGARPAELSTEFTAAHVRANAGCDDRGVFRWTKQEYLRMLADLHEAADALLARLRADELDAAAPEALRSYLPTTGDVLGMISGHEMMHAGQIAAIRRALGKPILI